MATRGTILVVDGPPDIADLLREVLALDGRRVLVAPTAEIGMQILGAFRVDLVITDALRPADAEPDDAWAELDRLVSAAGSAPLVLYAPDDPGRYAAYAEHGLAACLNKPLDLDALRALVGDLLPGVAPRPAPSVQG